MRRRILRSGARPLFGVVLAVTATACAGRDQDRAPAPMASRDRAPAAPAATPGDPGETVDDRTAGEVAADATEPDAGPGDQTTRNPFTGLSEALGAAPRGGLGSAPLLDEPGVALAPSTGGGAAPRGPEVTVQVAQVALTGGLERAAVAPTVGRARARVQACYHAALRAAPGLTGDVSARIEVGDGGQVGSLTVTHADDGVHDDDALLACATRTLGSLDFPAPTASPAVVTVRFAATVHR